MEMESSSSQELCERDLLQHRPAHGDFRQPKECRNRQLDVLSHVEMRRINIILAAREEKTSRTSLDEDKRIK